MATAMRRRATVLRALLPAVLALTVVSLLHAGSTPSVHYPGRWTPVSSVWPGIAVHLSLVRDTADTRYHSRIVWWNSEDELILRAGLFLWKPDDTDQCMVFPADTNFSSSIAIADPHMNLFCGAQTQTWDGRLLVAGGTEHGEVGIQNTRIYDPNQNAWSDSSYMLNARWYATTTTLPSGKVLVSSGSKYDNILSFGGKTSGSTALNSDLRRLGLLLAGHWDPTVTTPDVSGKWPQPLEGHAFINNVIFGGRDTSGAAQNGVYALSQDESPYGIDYGYHFDQLTPDNQATYLVALRRADHSAIELQDPVGGADLGKVFFGGIGRGDAGLDTTVHSDAFLLTSLGGNHLRWDPVAIGNSGPGRRYGHAAFYDPIRKRMLVYGGAYAANAAPADTDVWALDLSQPTNPATCVWTKPGVLALKSRLLVRG